MEGYRKGIFLSLIYGFVVLSSGFDAIAKDFGTLGHTYEIEEQDLLEYMQLKFLDIDLNAHAAKMKAKVKEAVHRPKPVLGITTAKENRTWYFDPTYTHQEDLKDHEGKIIHRKGYKVNPLKEIRLSKALIFIDGDDREQVDFAFKYRRKLQKRVSTMGEVEAIIILVKGSPLDLQKKHKTWIYFDQFGFLTTKLGIKRVPAVVSQGGMKLKIEEIKLTNKEGK